MSGNESLPESFSPAEKELPTHAIRCILRLLGFVYLCDRVFWVARETNSYPIIGVNMALDPATHFLERVQVSVGFRAQQRQSKYQPCFGLESPITRWLFSRGLDLRSR